jgi:hypothetical protein
MKVGDYIYIFDKIGINEDTRNKIGVILEVEEIVIRVAIPGVMLDRFFIRNSINNHFVVVTGKLIDMIMSL